MSMANVNASDQVNTATQQALTGEVLTTQSLPSNGSLPNGTLDGLPQSECAVVSFLDMPYLPWDNPANIVSAQVEELTSKVKDAIILPLLFLIGGPANVINMAVFHKQGLRERVNLCLFALSLADGLYLLQAMLLYGEQLYQWPAGGRRTGPLTFFVVNNNLVGFMGLAWVSQIMSAIIATERCLCVLSPLRFQTLLRTRTMAVIIAAVLCVVVGLYFFVAAKYRLACAHDVASGITMTVYSPSEFYHNHPALVDYLNTFVYGAGIPVVVMVVVATTTTITAVKIRQAARWRAESSSANETGGGASLPRDVALTKMLIGTSLLFLVCVFPIALFRLVWLFLPEVNPGRRQHNLFWTSLWLLDALSFVNSTFNIFVYYTMGSRYRHTLWALVRREKPLADKGKQAPTTLVETIK